MIKINYYHSLIFFNFCIFLSAFDYLRSNSLLIISLLFILSIGISHGSLDHIKGKKLMKLLGFKSSSIISNQNHWTLRYLINSDFNKVKIQKLIELNHNIEIIVIY